MPLSGTLYWKLIIVLGFSCSCQNASTHAIFKIEHSGLYRVSLYKYLYTERRIYIHDTVGAHIKSPLYRFQPNRSVMYVKKVLLQISCIHLLYLLHNVLAY